MAYQRHKIYSELEETIHSRPVTDRVVQSQIRLRSIRFPLSSFLDRNRVAMKHLLFD